MKYYYTYRISNTKLNKHYYGQRSSLLIPEDDLGKNYFSSSSNKEFIADQIINPNNYRYKVIKTYKNRKDAIRLEIKLHEYFNVAANPAFYNKANQKSTGFSPHFTKEDRLALSIRKKEYYALNPEVIDKIKATKRLLYDSCPAYAIRLSQAQKLRYIRDPSLAEKSNKVFTEWRNNLTKEEYDAFYKRSSQNLVKWTLETLKGKTYEEAYGIDKTREIKIKQSKPKSEEHRAKISKIKTGVKLSDSHRESISDALNERYKDTEYYNKFCHTMSSVNKCKDKRLSASIALKERWTDPVYLEKMKSRNTRPKKVILVIPPNSDSFEFVGFGDLITKYNFNAHLVRKSLKDNAIVISNQKNPSTKTLNTLGYRFKEIK